MAKERAKAQTKKAAALLSCAEIDPEECPYYLITRVSLGATAAMKRGFIEAGIGFVRPAYLGSLMSLWREDGLKVIDLGRRAGLEPSTMTGLLDRMERITLGQALDGRDAPFVGQGHRCDTRPDRFAVHQDGARPAAALATAVLRAGQMQVFPEHIKQRALRIGGDGPLRAVDP